MIMRTERAMYPLSTNAFNIAQSRKRDLQRNVGALIIYRDGAIKQIQGIRRLGLYGSRLGQKVSSALWGVYCIETQLKDVAISIPELCALISELLVLDVKGGDPTFEIENVEWTTESIRVAKSTAEILDLLHIPPIEDCLDVL